MIIESSKDIMFLAISLAIVALASAVSIMLFNLIMIIRDFRSLSKSIKEKVTLVDGLISTLRRVLDTIQDKLDHSAAYFGILVELVTKIVAYLRGNKERRKKNASRNDDQE